jgi:nucleotide-binding universal stress UspA family protein
MKTVDAVAGDSRTGEATRPLLVLFGTDGSEHAFRAGRVLARLLPPGSAEVRLVTVLSYSLYPYGPFGELMFDAERRLEDIQREQRRTTEEPRRLLDAAGHETQVHHRFGNPGDELLALANEWKPDLVVVGRRGLGHVSELVAGSVSAKLLHHSKVPVLVVP